MSPRSWRYIVILSKTTNKIIKHLSLQRIILNDQKSLTYNNYMMLLDNINKDDIQNDKIEFC